MKYGHIIVTVTSPWSANHTEKFAGWVAPIFRIREKEQMAQIFSHLISFPTELFYHMWKVIPFDWNPAEPVQFCLSKCQAQEIFLMKSLTTKNGNKWHYVSGTPNCTRGDFLIQNESNFLIQDITNLSKRRY
jgi:hypothetical protein